MGPEAGDEGCSGPKTEREVSMDSEGKETRTGLPRTERDVSTVQPVSVRDKAGEEREGKEEAEIEEDEDEEGTYPGIGLNVAVVVRFFIRAQPRPLALGRQERSVRR
jgi:hypothetical protein